MQLNHMKKCVMDLCVKSAEVPRKDYVLLKLTPTQGNLPEMLPGQFVEVRPIAYDFPASPHLHQLRG